MPKRRKINQARYTDAYNNREGNQPTNNYINWRELSDEKIEFYTPMEGMQKFNIIPFEIKSKMHPLVASGHAEVGELDIFLDFYVHRYVGPNKEAFICPKKTYGKRCPACEEMFKLYDAQDTESAKLLKPSRRAIMNIQPLHGGRPGGLQVFEVSHFLFMKELLEEAHACTGGDDIVIYADIEEGRVVSFRVIMEDFGGKKTPRFKSFKFEAREHQVSDALIDQALSFDDGLVLKSQEEIEKILYGGSDGGGVWSRQEDKAAPEKPNPFDDKKEDAPVVRERPAPVQAQPREEEVKKPDAGNKCPYGHQWGKDTDKKPECNTCKEWDACFEGR